MVRFGKYKLSDAIRQLCRKAGGDKGGKPVRTHETAAEQVREAQESSEADNAGRRVVIEWLISAGATSKPVDRVNEVH